MAKLKNEPAAIVGVILAVVTNALGLLAAFGLDLTAGQQAAIMGTVNSVLILLGTIGVIRANVTPLADGGMPADT